MLVSHIGYLLGLILILCHRKNNIGAICLPIVVICVLPSRSAKADFTTSTFVLSFWKAFSVIYSRFKVSDPDTKITKKKQKTEELTTRDVCDGTHLKTSLSKLHILPIHLPILMVITTLMVVGKQRERMSDLSKFTL